VAITMMIEPCSRAGDVADVEQRLYSAAVSSGAAVS
jgi:hypothetical protein